MGLGTLAGVEVEGPLVPVAGDDVALDLARRQVGPGVGTGSLSDHEPIRVCQVEDGQLMGAGGDELGLAGRTFLRCDQPGPGIGRHGGVKPRMEAAQTPETKGAASF